MSKMPDLNWSSYIYITAAMSNCQKWQKKNQTNWPKPKLPKVKQNLARKFEKKAIKTYLPPPPKKKKNKSFIICQICGLWPRKHTPVGNTVLRQHQKRSLVGGGGGEQSSSLAGLKCHYSTCDGGQVTLSTFFFQKSTQKKQVLVGTNR